MKLLLERFEYDPFADGDGYVERNLIQRCSGIVGRIRRNGLLRSILWNLAGLFPAERRRRDWEWQEMQNECYYDWDCEDF